MHLWTYSVGHAVCYQEFFARRTVSLLIFSTLFFNSSRETMEAVTDIFYWTMFFSWCSLKMRRSMYVFYCYIWGHILLHDGKLYHLQHKHYNIMRFNVAFWEAMVYLDFLKYNCKEYFFTSIVMIYTYCLLKLFVTYYFLLV